MIKIILTFFIISSIQLSASVWQRVDGPYELKSITSIFNFNNQIYVSSKEGVYEADGNNKWDITENEFFTNFGRVRTFYQHENVALIGGWSGNLLVTYNTGNTWEEIEKINNGMFGYEAVVIVDNTIFAQEGLSSGNSLYKLEKGSKDWEIVYFDSQKNDLIFANHIVSDGNYIFAGDEDVDGINNTGGGITVSSDKGKTWYKLDNFKRPVTNMVIHNDKLFVASSDNHIYHSSDRGISWEVDTTLIMPTDHFLSHNGNLFVAVNNSASSYKVEYGLMMSTDDGITWKTRSNGLYTINLEDIEVVDSKLFVLDNRYHVFESTDNGNYWTKSNLVDSNVYSSHFIVENDTLYVSAGIGIFYSTDKGSSWHNKSEELDKASLRLGEIYKNKNVIVGVDFFHLSMIISSDWGETWQFGGITYQQGWIGNILILEDKIVVTSTYEDFETRFTTDYGKTWEVFDDPVLKKEYSLGKLLRENEQNLTLFTSGGIMKSTNNGIDWEKLDEGSSEVSFYVDDNGIYYGLDSELYVNKSVDKGLSWESTGFKITDYKGGFLFDVIDDHLFISMINGIKVSSNFGKTFNEYLLDTNLLKEKSDIFGDIIKQGEYLLGSTHSGIWRTKLSDIGITPTSVETQRNYLYTLPPYPLPSQNEVKVQFYWDINLPMTTDDISIYDITGKKIDAFDKISLVKQANHYGNLIWDCSTAQPGIYLINIKQGTEEKAVKVVVE